LAGKKGYRELFIGNKRSASNEPLQPTGADLLVLPEVKARSAAPAAVLGR
jgi:hypothetical protein